MEYLRPREIAEDNSSDLEFIKFHLAYQKEKGILAPDYVVNLRPTAPFRKVSVIKRAIKAFIEAQPSASSLRSVHRIDATPYKMFKIDNGYLRPFIVDPNITESHSSARQNFCDTFIGNGYVDILKSSTISDHSLLYGENILAFETEESLDIDSADDLDTANFLLSQDALFDLVDLPQ